MTVGVGWGHCTSNLNDTDLNSSLLTSSFDINMLTCVVNRSIHWYKCTISPFHCCSQPRNTYCHRNLHANVFSSADMDDTDDDDFMLIIVHFKSLYCRSSCRWSRQHFPAALSLAAVWRHRDWCGASGADIGCIQRLREQFPVFPQIPPATLNLVFSSLDLSWGKLSSRASGHRRLMGLCPPPPLNLGCLVSSLRSLDHSSIRLLIASVCVIFCLNHMVTLLRVQ